jgi:hypothetical protein
MSEELVTAATYAAWKQFARHTPVRFDNRLKRPETPEEAMWRRFQQLPPKTLEENRRIALAVLNVAENAR